MSVTAGSMTRLALVSGRCAHRKEGRRSWSSSGPRWCGSRSPTEGDVLRGGTGAGGSASISQHHDAASLTRASSEFFLPGPYPCSVKNCAMLPYSTAMIPFDSSSARGGRASVLKRHIVGHLVQDQTPGRASSISLNTPPRSEAPILRPASSAYSSSFSAPTKKQPSSLEATPLVPDPQKGSKTRSPSLVEATMARRTRRKGFWVG